MLRVTGCWSLLPHGLLPVLTGQFLHVHRWITQSPKDAEKLKEAKERVYLKGFYEGIMKVRACVRMLALCVMHVSTYLLSC